jgi:phage major head subunit gpT-like protein
MTRTASLRVRVDGGTRVGLASSVLIKTQAWQKMVERAIERNRRAKEGSAAAERERFTGQDLCMAL